MSEEILKALMELFALVVKQDSGILLNEREYVSDFLNKQLSKEAVNEYLALFDEHAGPVLDSVPEKPEVAPSVKDSVKILSICKKINRTLNQEQKVVVLMRLFELVNADRKFTSQRMNLINTVAEVFRISQDEFTSIEQFIKNDNAAKLRNPAILVLSPEEKGNELCKKMINGYLDTTIVILRITTVDLYFIKYYSKDQLYLNGLPVYPKHVYTFAKGGSIKSFQGFPIYYSDVSSIYLSEVNIHKISFTVENLTYNFREGLSAVNDVSFSFDEGKLIGIIGASGSGKTTLLNLMSGIQTPTSGTIKINGIDIHENNEAIEGVLGYVPQDDLLIEDLTVFENLYYSACQCFGKKNREELVGIVKQTLSNLGLSEKSYLKVGSPMNKVISGGQRKRLNIALELIREPSVLLLDEPTSGLSSKDSENLMSLLRDLTKKGKLIISVIHQPSSEVFKMFDKIIVLDQGGYMTFFGNPIESVIYFKTLDAQINASIGECPTCGNVNSETIFNILDIQVVDEFGRYTEKRRVKPADWADSFKNRYPFTPVHEITEPPHKNLERPSLFKQFVIYLSRDFSSKIANRQYLMLTLLEAPILGFILSFIIRYIPDPNSSQYIFSENENIPIYIFMSLIVALFLGLTISAEEIFRDRKILKREQFLNLSRNSYLASKVTMLIGISLIQVALFLVIANPILEIKGMFFRYFLALFSTAFCANMLGLNISASFNSAITIYIVIPLVIIPMMVLSGAMFSFDKLNREIGSVDKVPVIAELMPTRWTYEALIVTQFKDNLYSQIEYNREKETYYILQKKISEAEFNKIYRIPALREALETTLSEYIEFRSNPKNVKNTDNLLVKNSIPDFSKLQLLRNELIRIVSINNIPEFENIDHLTPAEFNPEIAESLTKYFDRINAVFSTISNSASDRSDRFRSLNNIKLIKLEKEYYNYKLEEIVRKPYERKKILLFKNSLIQNTDPVYLDPLKKGFLNFRTHFFAPGKYIFGTMTDTFKFNISIVLLSTVFLYIFLYYELLGRLVKFIENLNFKK
jgi:ABC transport system ATP-binding/permease protein